MANSLTDQDARGPVVYHICIGIWVALNAEPASKNYGLSQQLIVWSEAACSKNQQALMNLPAIDEIDHFKMLADEQPLI